MLVPLNSSLQTMFHCVLAANACFVEIKPAIRIRFATTPANFISNLPVRTRLQTNGINLEVRRSLCKTFNVMVVVGGIGNTLIDKKRNNSYKMLNLIRQYVTYFTTCQKNFTKCLDSMKMSPCGRGCGSNPGQHGDIDKESERTGLDDDHDRDQTPGTNTGASGRTNGRQLPPEQARVARYRADGDAGLVHRLRGRPATTSAA